MLAPLQAERDAAIINAEWTYASKHTLHTVKECIEARPSCGVWRRRHADDDESNADDTLLGWAVVRCDLSIGMLKIDDSLRRRGVASLVVRRLTHEILDKCLASDAALGAAEASSICQKYVDDGPTILAYTDLANTAGNALFDKLGFERADGESAEHHWGRWTSDETKVTES